MNNPSPLVPQGSNLEQKQQGRARFKVAVLCVIGIHVVGLVALLLTQGCKRDQPPATGAEVQPLPGFTDTNLPAGDTNLLAVPDTNGLSNPNMLPSGQPSIEPQAATVYAIAKGDTFYDLAKKYHVTMQALKDANPTVNPSKLQIGQKINIPAPTAAPAATPGGAPAPAADSGALTHKVQSGDTLLKLAAKYGVTVKALRAANNLATDRIVVGQVLKIPAKATAPAPEPPPATPPAR